MEKNRMMRLASALLILTLLTTCMISGTFAKYTTQATGGDTARVAKWGVTVNVTSDLFADAYKDTSVEYNGTTATVKASAKNQNIVAPGTTGIGLGVASTGTPEVSYEMKIKLNDTTAKMPSLKYTPTGGTEASYEPVKFNVYNGDTKLNVTDPLTLDELKDLFNGTNVIYKYDVADGKYYVYVDKDGDGTIDSTPSDTCPNIQIKWEWAYEDAANKELYDELDTILGNTAAAASGADPINKYNGGGENSISGINTDANLTWTVTATQID